MANLKVYLTAHTKQFRRAMRRADRTVARLSKKIKRYGVIAGGAFAAVAAKSVQAAMKQEDAERALAAALRSHGDAASDLMPYYTKLAAAMQRETVFGDELILQQMAQIRNLGVMPSQLEAATKGAIGLAAALGLDSKAAARYTALAMQGEYTILQRYVPALRAAETAAEKHAIVQDLMARGYAQAKEQAQTASGQFKQFKNSVGDLMEVFGGLVMELFSFGDTTGGAQAYVKKLADTLKARTPEIAYVVRVAFTEIKFAFLQVWEVGKRVWKNLSTFIRASVHNMVELFKVLKSHGKAIWNNFGTYARVYARVAADNIMSRFRSLFTRIIEGFAAVWKSIKKGDIKGALGAWGNAAASAIKDQVKITADAPRQLREALAEAGIDIYKPEYKDALRGMKDAFGAVDELERKRVAERAKLRKAYELRVAKEVAAKKAELERRAVENAAKGLGGLGAAYAGVMGRAVEGVARSQEFAGAMTRGSQEAYSVSLRQRRVDKSQERTADNTKSIDKKMSALIDATEQNAMGVIA